MTTLTNAHEAETVTRSVIKNWVDEGNPARPNTLNVFLLADGEVILTVPLTAANRWRATLEDLPRYANGKEIEYTWREARVNGYTQTNLVTADGVTTTSEPLIVTL